ncbi:hypothetical protein Fcan01_06995 [Folsomia candida]|uniref:Uncharacterized protein n=1 Tax=Folsomia candida TaxID=158441 RepID=A0A226ELU1_FOLCA|nr:hypothetical protein Fcan01_06995 [Folsomia candida]
MHKIVLNATKRRRNEGMTKVTCVMFQKPEEKMSTAFGTPAWSSNSFCSSSTSSSPSSSRSSSTTSSPSTSPPENDSNKFNWMEAITNLQSQITAEAKVKRKYAIYTIPEETKDELTRYKMK